jgi:short-subunit dehydrogenase
MKYTMITGASSGIGKALAYEFAEKGHHLVLVARRSTLLNQLKEELEEMYQINVVTKPCDLTDIHQVSALYEELRVLHIETLINNAGSGDYSYPWDGDLDKVNRMVDLNVKALTTLSLSYIKDYQDEDATLINVSSGGGYFIFNKAVTYCATKFFVSAFTEGLAQNLLAEKKKMRAKILLPGATETEFVKNSESNASFKGADLFDADSFMKAEVLATFAYDLYKSDKIIGAVTEDNLFELKDPIFPYGG